MKRNRVVLMVLVLLALGIGNKSEARVFGLGFATYGGSSQFSNTPSISGILELSPSHTLQFFSAVTDVDPFEFSFGSIFRFNVWGTQNLGWHLGFGFDLGAIQGTAGSKSTFYMKLLLPVSGFSFSLGGAANNIRISFDGGALMHLTPSPFEMTVGSFGQFLGASIHCFF